MGAVAAPQHPCLAPKLSTSAVVPFEFAQLRIRQFMLGHVQTCKNGPHHVGGQHKQPAYLTYSGAPHRRDTPRHAFRISARDRPCSDRDRSRRYRGPPCFVHAAPPVQATGRSRRLRGSHPPETSTGFSTGVFNHQTFRANTILPHLSTSGFVGAVASGPAVRTRGTTPSKSAATPLRRSVHA